VDQVGRSTGGPDDPDRDTWLSQALDGVGGPTEQARARRPAGEKGDLSDFRLNYLRANTGHQRAEQIAAALATDSRTRR
jgi:hypothetical protein